MSIHNMLKIIYSPGPLLFNHFRTIAHKLYSIIHNCLQCPFFLSYLPIGCDHWMASKQHLTTDQQLCNRIMCLVQSPAGNMMNYSSFHPAYYIRNIAGNFNFAAVACLFPHQNPSFSLCYFISSNSLVQPRNSDSNNSTTCTLFLYSQAVNEFAFKRWTKQSSSSSFLKVIMTSTSATPQTAMSPKPQAKKLRLTARMIQQQNRLNIYQVCTYSTPWLSMIWRQAIRYQGISSHGMDLFSRNIPASPPEGLNHSQHRISAGGSLLFMRCVSLTLTGLISAWRRGEASSANLAKSLSDCVTVFVCGNANQGIWKFVEVWKGHATFKQMGYLTFLTWTFVVYAVGDAGSTCCCFGLLLLTTAHLIREPPLLRKLKLAFANKNSSLNQTMISFIFVKIYAS